MPATAISMKFNARQPWIFSPVVDLFFILGPAFLVTALAILLHEHIEIFTSVPPWLWLLLVVGVDVSHVYSTLFRTYFDRVEMRKRQALYLLTPLIAWVAGCLLYSLGSQVFWRVLAYLAVFHFVRQQYGLMMIYGRKEEQRYKWIDKLAIYAATVYPLIYWHGNERNFDWFIEGDFFKFDSSAIVALAGLVYLAILFAYLSKELLLWRQQHGFNWPRNLLLFGTALSWLFGIVIFNNDVAFTAINVISHGVPYLALMWIYGRNQAQLQGEQTSFQFRWVATIFRRKWVLIYLGVLFAWAWFEENLWDGLIWHDHGTVLYFADKFPIIQSEQTLVWLVPLLAMPQITHYVLDAFIWRMHHSNTNWKEIFFLNAR
jgi:hypothetical protein